MDQQNKESMPFRYLPSSRQVVIHLVAMITISSLLGPLLGPLLINWINPPQAWGVSTSVGDYSLMNVLVWGLAMLMFEAFFYTAWLISLGRKSWEKDQPKSWYN